MTARTVYPATGHPEVWVAVRYGFHAAVSLHLPGVGEVSLEVLLLPDNVVANAAVKYARAWVQYPDPEDRAMAINSLLGRCADGCCGPGGDFPPPGLTPTPDYEGDWSPASAALHYVHSMVCQAGRR